jgi:hypothetical protein
MRQVILFPWTLTEIAKKSRHVQSIAAVTACAAFLFGVQSLPALGQVTVGLVVGTTRDSATGKPVAEVQIIAHNVEKGTDITSLSHADGTFAIANLEPGLYEVAAIKDGFLKSSAKVEVAAPGDSSIDLTLVVAQSDRAADAEALQAVASASPAQSNAAMPGDSAGAATPASAVSTAAQPAPKGFWNRFIKAYADDWHPGPDNGAAPKYRGYPMPISNPPFPFNIWPIGGTVWIGYPNATAYPLTTALQNGPHGDWWKKTNIQIYGWANVGMNISTSSARPYGNLPAAYAEIPNTVQLDQVTMYVERTPDTIQTDHFDWGFRLTNLYGLDYRFTTAKGYFSQQLLNNPQKNGSLGRKMGYDPVMAYVDLYFPKIGKGTDVRIGRYISLPDIEAQLAPNNYTYSHSLTYTYDCYTQTGINATTKWSNHWTTQIGLSGGCEAAPWSSAAKLTANVCVGYTWTEGRDNIYVCANSLNDNKYNYNNLAAYYTTWYHKFGRSNWHMAWETWYQYMKDTPNVNNPGAASLLINNSNGAVCRTPEQLTCFAPDWATVHYLNRQLGKRDALIFRNEYFNDIKGQRTGFKTKYTEHLISWNHWIGTTVVFRPELRYEHAYDAPAYNNGTKKSQFMFAADVIWFF